MKTIAAILLATLSASQACAFELSSPDIRDGQPIAKVQISPRCGGDNVAPALSWRDVPAGTRSFALTMIDLTARPPLGWAHWIVVDIPATMHAIPAGGSLPDGARAILGSSGNGGYFGPCPPEGTGVHQYVFTLYALPGPTPELAPKGDPRETAARLSAAASAETTLTGTAQR
jgi:Raf kinase inhibitor-like YbhB/YbcL family protein